jgi:isocitrate lyase
MSTREQQIAALEKDWAENPRWKGIKRGYSAADVVRLRGSFPIEYTLARRAAEKLWKLVNTEPYVNCLGALTGGQAMQQVKAGVKAIYLSGWQVAADNNSYASMYPDQSLYPVDSVPKVVERINNSFRAPTKSSGRRTSIQGRQGLHRLLRADRRRRRSRFRRRAQRLRTDEGDDRSGAGGVHFEDQLASVKKCGHMGGKVLVPTQEAVQKLIAARFRRRRLRRADAGHRAHRRRSGRSADLRPRRKRQALHHRRAHQRRLLQDAQGSGAGDLARRRLRPVRRSRLVRNRHAGSRFARKFAEGVHAKHPGKLLAYNCSPSFNWKKNLDDATIAKFQRELGAMGYKYQFITLAGIHNMWYHMFDLAQDYVARGMTAYVEKVQEPEFAARDRGYTFVSHQQEVGTGYFDDVTTVIQGGASSVTALTGSTEEEQFHWGLPGNSRQESLHPDDVIGQSRVPRIRLNMSRRIRCNARNVGPRRIRPLDQLADQHRQCPCFDQAQRQLLEAETKRLLLRLDVAGGSTRVQLIQCGLRQFGRKRPQHQLADLAEQGSERNLLRGHVGPVGGPVQCNR